MGSSGLEPPTSRLSGARSSLLSYEPVVVFRFPSLSPFASLKAGGDEGIRTLDPLLAGQVLSQLSYTPILWGLLQDLPDFMPVCALKIEQPKTTFDFPLTRLPVTSDVSSDFLFSLSMNIITLVMCYFLHRKGVIQPHLPIRLPCYDLTPIIVPTFGSCPLAVSSLTSGIHNFHGLTGGVYKARERIHRNILIYDY